MPANESGSDLKQWQTTLQAWMAGDHAVPLVIPRNERWPVERVLFPSWRSHVKSWFRYLMVQAGDAAPFCPLKAFFYRRAGARIANGACISPGVIMEPMFPWLIEVEEGACLGMGCRLIAHEYTASQFRLGRIRVGPGSVVGMYSTVRGGVTIGEHVTIGANSYVNRDATDGETVAGVPARPIKQHEEG